MTWFWLFLSKVFKWSFGFYDLFAFPLNWIFFLVCVVFFCYWVYVLVSPLGGNRDLPYKSPSKQIRPYLDPTVMKVEKD